MAIISGIFLFLLQIYAMDDAILEDIVADPDAYFPVDSSKTSESREKRTVRSQKEIHDADKAELLTLEESFFGSGGSL